MRISDWSSDVCSSDLGQVARPPFVQPAPDMIAEQADLVERGFRLMKGQPPGFIDGKPCAKADDPRRAVEMPRRMGDAFDQLVAGRALMRSEERRVGKECVSTCGSRWSP